MINGKGVEETMKKTMVGIVVIAVLAAGFLAILPEEERDLLNPLVPREEIYVQINKPGTPRGAGGYDYTLPGYTAEGEQREVTFYAGKKLREQAYLKVTAKGAYVETWAEVQFEQLPEKAKRQLQTSQ